MERRREVQNVLVLHFRAEYAEGVKQHSPGSPRTRRTPGRCNDGDRNPSGFGPYINRTTAYQRDGVRSTLPIAHNVEPR